MLIAARRSNQRAKLVQVCYMAETCGINGVQIFAIRMRVNVAGGEQSRLHHARCRMMHRFDLCNLDISRSCIIQIAQMLAHLHLLNKRANAWRRRDASLHGVGTESRRKSEFPGDACHGKRMESDYHFAYQDSLVPTAIRVLQ